MAHDISGGPIRVSGVFGPTVPRDEREVVIEHPEIPGAIMRIPAYLFDPTKHRRWPAGFEPWMDGSGQPIPGRQPPHAT